MFSSKTLYKFVVAGLLSCSGISNAAIYDFGNKLTGPNYVPTTFASDPFARLTTKDNGGGVWTFTLNVDNTLFQSFGSGAFIGSMSFDFSPDPISQTKSTFIASNIGGVTAVGSTSGTGNSGLTDIDFGTSFGKGANNRLAANDWVTWSVSGLGLSNLTNMYVHVQGIGSLGDSAKYTPIVSPVPEAETYAMFLAGLALVGFSARRRVSNNGNIFS